MQDTVGGERTLGGAVVRGTLWRASEIVVPFIVGVSVILCVGALIGDNPLVFIASIWIANVLMLAMVYLGLRLRGQGCAHLGLNLRPGSWQSALRTVWQSGVVFVAGTFAFAIGAILMANLVGIPEGADMSKYAYLRGNLTMTILALASVYLVSSFAEEVIYRGFLITRITELGGSGKIAQWCAVVISSIVFGLVHSDWGLTGMVQASCMGLALGVSYLAVQRNLWVMILAHGYMDTVLILQMYFADR